MTREGSALTENDKAKVIDHRIGNPHQGVSIALGLLHILTSSLGMVSGVLNASLR